MTQKNQIKADEYRERALVASTLAEAAVLAAVREMHLRAAASWTDLAERQDLAIANAELRLTASRAALLAKAPAAPVAEPPPHDFDISTEPC